MSLTTEMQQKIFESLNDGYGQVKFFQDSVVILDNDKSDWDNAIFKLDSELFGEIQIVNNAINDVNDLYSSRLSGVSSCRTDLFWMVLKQTAGSPPDFNLLCVKINPNGYEDIVRERVTNSTEASEPTGVGSTFFYYIDPATAGFATAPLNRAVAVEQGRSVDDVYIGMKPRNYYGLKYYNEPYANDIGDTFVTSFIGTIAAGSNKLTVMNPLVSTGQDSSISPIYETGQIVTCDKEGVFSTTNKITGIDTGSANLQGLPTQTGIASTNTSTVNILSLSASAGAAVSTFDSISFTVLGNPETGPVGRIGDVTSNGEVYQVDKPFYAIRSTSDLGGRGATFAVHTNASGGIATVGYSTIKGGVAIDVIGSGGLGYSVGETITIGGTSLILANGKAGVTPTDDISFPVEALQEGRFRFGFVLAEDPSVWPDPHDPQTVGIMSSNNLGIGIRIELDNSGAPRGSQGWDARLGGLFLPENINNPRNSPLVQVVAPNVGADKSYWTVGFQTAPTVTGGSSLRVEGGIESNIEESDFSSYLTTLSACSASVETSISDAIGIVTTTEVSFNDQEGRNKIIVDAANALREERNELCMRIWGNRTAIGDLNNKITRYESLRGYIGITTIEDIIG